MMKKKSLILTNVTGSTDVVNFSQWMGMSGHSVDMENYYYAHVNYKTSDYDRCIAYVDTGWYPSMELQESIIRKCRVLKERGFTLVLGNLWESVDQIKQTSHAEFLSEFDYRIWDGGKTFFWYLMYDRYLHSKFAFDHSMKNHVFLYLNKMQRPHREALYQNLQAEGLLGNSLVSYWQKGIHLDQQYELPCLEGKEYPRYGRDRDIYEKPYNESVFNIVSETSDYETFFTEKIWKPIMAGQPFVVHGKPNYLKDLRALGFETFHEFFDESYDTERSDEKRISMIVELCRNLTEVSKNYQKFYDDTKSVREHNTKNFFNKESLASAIHNEVATLFEFVDSGKISSRKS